MGRFFLTGLLLLFASIVTAQQSAAPSGYVYKCSLPSGQVSYARTNCPLGATFVLIGERQPAANDPSNESDLVTHKHYVNHAGEVVHSPSATVSHTVPAGASAVCGDGSYSFSRSRRGTCSHHGGVAQWL